MNIGLEKYTNGFPYLLLQFTGKYDSNGFKSLLLTFVNKDKAVDKLLTISGSPAAQKRAFLHPSKDYSGSGNSIPEGIYSIEQTIVMHVPEKGVGVVKIPLFVLPGFKCNNRSEFLFHDDSNRAYARGSLGCVVTYTEKDMARIVNWRSQKAYPQVIVVDYNLGLLKSKSVEIAALDQNPHSQRAIKISLTGINLIKQFEGCRLEAYYCPAGVLTIGYGHTKIVSPGLHITQQKANELLALDLALFEAAVAQLVKVPLTQCQVDALISFVYNVGVGAFTSSTLLKKLNAKDYVGAASEFSRWNKASGAPLAGLTKRREAERKLFLA